MHDFTGASALAKSRNETLSESPFSPAEDAARKQLKLVWLESTVTQEIIKDLGNEADTLIEQAIAVAVDYPQSQNHLRIVQCLVKANQIRNTINKYAKV